MSSAAFPGTSILPGDPTSPPAIPLQEPRGWLAQVILDTFRRPGALLGGIWIVIISLLAFLAPLLANTYPLLLKMDGKWSSPMASHLTAIDVALFATLGLTGVVWFLPTTLPRRGLIVAAGAFATLTVALLFLKPAETEVFEQYRAAIHDGRVQWVLMAPVPYSPGDHLNDQFDIENPHPWAPQHGHPLGTNSFGSDIASHLIYACRIALAVGFIATAIEFVIGVVIGGLMGYFVGIVDLLGMRLVEIFSSIPTIYLLLAFVSVFGRNIYIIMLILGLTGWVENARFVRAEFLKLRHQDFVQAAIAAGLPLRSILFRHLLPNALAPLLVSTSFGVASAILYESVLSFLGLGIPVGEASWGQLLNEAVSAGGGFHWWLAAFPGAAIFLTVLAYNLIGEAMRDAMDPRLRGA